MDSSSSAEEHECPKKMAATTLLGVRESPRHFSLSFTTRKQRRSHNPNRPVDDRGTRMNASETTALDEPSEQLFVTRCSTAPIAPTATSTTTYVSISAIGFGIGNCATVAAQQALQDAMGRTQWHMSRAAQPQLGIQIGVPASLPLHTNELDLPPGVTSIHIVPGGLLVDVDPSSSLGAIVSVVACITLKIPIATSTVPPSNAKSAVPSTKADPMVTPEASVPLPSTKLSQASAIPTSPSTTFSQPIEMLAMVSERLVHQTTTNPRNTPIPTMGRGSASSTTSSEDSPSRRSSMNGSYIKLPPGKTTKNHERLFVKHQYCDYSKEEPTQDEIVVQFTDMSPNAAFPLKLHETLSAIEKDGLASIVGWLPHGRAFKILNTQEFNDIVLPRYFVMSKKSSFLRQLNLYGFHRLSAGPDQGAYYHALFLRSKKFLCKRITRQKVNGNRIRSAGNPEEEPPLAAYPILPPIPMDGY